MEQKVDLINWPEKSECIAVICHAHGLAKSTIPKMSDSAEEIKESVKSRAFPAATL
jgi:hypothetical protein